jgi:hypothetical protein
VPTHTETSAHAPLPEAPRRISRRTLLAGGAGAAVLALAGVPVAVHLLQGGRGADGKLVTELLQTKGFSIAHAGGSANWPEMSMEAYRQAVAHGVNALEVSLARSADGVWFGLHDATLDRTSGTSGFVAAEHTWAQISRHRIGAAATTDRNQDPQPYLRFQDLVDAYAGTHTIFVDPKVVPTVHHPELLKAMKAVPHPSESFVAKFYCTGTEWARAARAQGFKTWGYYYGREVDDGSTPLADTQADWDLLGLDVAASAAAWSSVTSYGKPVVAHIVADPGSARASLARGAAGLMISNVLAVLGTH